MLLQDVQNAVNVLEGLQGVPDPVRHRCYIKIPNRCIYVLLRNTRNKIPATKF